MRQIQGKQRRIEFAQDEDSLLLDTERQTCLAKWHASFESRREVGAPYRKVEFVQVAMLEFGAGGLITKLEEYWTSRGDTQLLLGCCGRRKRFISELVTNHIDCSYCCRAAWERRTRRDDTARENKGRQTQAGRTRATKSPCATSEDVARCICDAMKCWTYVEMFATST